MDQLNSRLNSEKSSLLYARLYFTSPKNTTVMEWAKIGVNMLRKPKKISCFERTFTDFMEINKVFIYQKLVILCSAENCLVVTNMQLSICQVTYLTVCAI